MDIITRLASPNFDDRNAGSPLQFIVLHYTGMRSGNEALERLCDAEAKVSAHYMVEEDGRIFKLVDEAKRAWHAGKGKWKNVTDINSASIGIELVNPGHQYGYRLFPVAQIKALIALMQDIVKRHNLNPALAPLAHADIAPERKEDPGELFPWQELAQAGLGLWPEVRQEDYGHADDGEVQKLLSAIGYDCPATGAYDRPTRAVLVAFQRHYEPSSLTGTPERETIARLRSLRRALEQHKASTHPGILTKSG